MRLQAPDSDRAALMLSRAPINPLAPAAARPPVEDEQMGFIGVALVGVIGGLREAFGNHFFGRGAGELQFEHDALHALRVRPGDEQIGPFAAQAVLAPDVAAAIHDALQEGLQ